MFLTRFEPFSVPSRNLVGQTDREPARRQRSPAWLPSVALSDERWLPSFYFLPSFCENPLSCSTLRCSHRQPWWCIWDKALRGVGYFLMLSQCAVGTSGVSSRPKTLPSPHGWTPRHELGQALPLCCCSLSRRDDPALQPARVSLFLFCFFFIFNSDPESAQVMELSLSWFKETTSHI